MRPRKGRSFEDVPTGFSGVPKFTVPACRTSNPSSPLGKVASNPGCLAVVPWSLSVFPTRSLSAFFPLANVAPSALPQSCCVARKFHVFATHNVDLLQRQHCTPSHNLLASWGLFELLAAHFERNFSAFYPHTTKSHGDRRPGP